MLCFAIGYGMSLGCVVHFLRWTHGRSVFWRTNSSWGFLPLSGRVGKVRLSPSCKRIPNFRHGCPKMRLTLSDVHW